MRKEAFPQVLLQDVENESESLIGRFGEHAIAAGDEAYIQPHVYLSFHLVQMRAACWRDMDFDHLAAASGASALFAYQPGEFMPKYAHLWIGLDKRIAEATGFGYEWVGFEGVDGAWHLLREMVDSGRSVKGWHWENVLFAGYQDASAPEGRSVFAMGDGPETFARWWSWQDFVEWVKLVEGWGQAQFGRHAGRVPTEPEERVAQRVMADLVKWSTEPPATVREKFPEAAFGLVGIEAYAADCANTEQFEDWTVCHDINPQWAVRNSTAVYLRRVAQSGLFPGVVSRAIEDTAEAYRAAYTAWCKLYELLGHGATEGERKDPSRREAGAAAVRKALEHERAGIEKLKAALLLIGS